MVKIESRYYKEDKETLLHLSISEVKGNSTVERVYPFYVNETGNTIDSALLKALNELPTILEAVYRSGLAKEEITFDKKVIPTKVS